MDTEQVQVDGPIRFTAADGYRLDTSDATVDLKTRKLQERRRGDGHGAAGDVLRQPAARRSGRPYRDARRQCALADRARRHEIARRCAAPLLLLALLARRARGGAERGTTPNAPIDFGADHIELQDKANRAVLSGNVTVKQAEMTLNAARMTVAYTGQVVGGRRRSRGSTQRAG